MTDLSTPQTLPGKFPVTIPLTELLGLSLELMESERAIVTCNYRDDLCNSYGYIHGGVMLALIDVALIHAARAPGEAGGILQPSCVTVDINASFIRPANGPLKASAHVIGRTSSLAFCEAVVTNKNGEICARGSGTLRYIKLQAAAPVPRSF